MVCSINTHIICYTSMVCSINTHIICYTSMVCSIKNHSMEIFMSTPYILILFSQTSQNH